MYKMTKTPRFLLASAAAALSTIIIPVAIGLYVFFKGSSVLPYGTPDNTPFRAAGVLLFLMPFIFAILVGVWYLVTKGLFHFNALTKTKLFLFCIACGILLGCIFAIDGYKAFGLKDAIISFIVFFSHTFVSLGLGGLVWWPVAHTRHNKPVHPTPKAGAFR